MTVDQAEALDLSWPPRRSTSMSRRSGNLFWQLTVDGLAYGSIYALVAVGYTLVYGVLRLINFAHSEIFMLGMFGQYAVLMMLGFAPSGNVYDKGVLLTICYLGLAMLGGMLVSGGAAVGLERVAYRPAAQAQRALAGLPDHRHRRVIRHPGVRALHPARSSPTASSAA